MSLSTFSSPLRAVWRMQYLDGVGPYNSSLADYELQARLSIRHTDSYRHPAPIEDGLMMTAELSLYGCPSRELLEEWFGEFYDLLIEDGASVLRFVAPRASIKDGRSGYQLRFARDLAMQPEVIIQGHKQLALLRMADSRDSWYN